MAKRKNVIKVSFEDSSAAEHVTGSCYHVQTSELQFLIECGLSQSNNVLTDYRVNSEKFGFKTKSLDYIFIPHVHGDHMLRLPLVFARGCSAKIIMPKGSTDIAKEMMLDSAHIAQRDAEYLSKHLGRSVPALYTEEDVYKTVAHIEEYDFGLKHELRNDLKFEFIPSGHIVSSAQLVLWVSEKNQTKKIAYTSDLGNDLIQGYYTNKFEPIKNANLFIGETTYGDDKKKVSTQASRDKDIYKIKEIVQNTCIQHKSKVLIPVFSLQRSQEMLTTLYDIYGNDPDFQLDILLDSPLMKKINKIFFRILEGEQLEKWKEVMSWKNIVQINEWTETKHWAEGNKPCVILASSGMLTAGRAITYTKNILSDQYAHILFCGFSAEGSLASKIKEGKERILTIDGDKCRNRCKITSLTSFSSHMQYPSLMKYYSEVNAEQLVLVHGESKAKLKFAKDLQEEISKKCKTTKVTVANRSMTINL